MKRIKLINILLCTVVLFVSLPFSSSAEEITAEFVPDEIIISTENPIIDSSAGFYTMSNSPATPIDFEENEILSVEELEIENDNQNEATYVAEIDGDVLELCEELEKLPGVQYAEPNYIYHTTEFKMPGEVTRPSPLYEANQQYYLEDVMHIPSAWNEFETAGENVVVAVIDNGFKINAKEFSVNLWTDENGNHGWNTYKNSSDISPIYKSNGTQFGNTEHGTNVAGIIGMEANNLNGVGAAYNAELMLINAAKYNNDNEMPDFATTDIVEGIDYAVANGADVINMSLGGFGKSDSLSNAVNRAYNAGIAIIAAAGNSGVCSDSAVSYPAGYSNVIGVMAVDNNYSRLAYFSNYNGRKQVYDVAAPGVSIVGCSCQDNKLIAMSGTSQASPLVAACAALYISKYPDNSVAQLYEALRNSPTMTVTSNSETETENTYYYKVTNAVELLNYGKVEPEIEFNIYTTSVTSDPYKNYIYGLDEGYESISNYVTVAEGTGVAELVETPNGNGTGALFNVYDIYGDLYKSYTIIIFGDVNGDAYADGQDAVEISAIINSPELFTDPVKYAADVDFNDIIDESDYVSTAKAAVKKNIILQSR